jgi:hypothetical protein
MEQKAQQMHLSNSAFKQAESLKAKLAGINSQLNALAELLSTLPISVPAGPIYQQMELLQEKKNSFSEELRKLDLIGQECAVPIELASYQGLLKGFEKDLVAGSSEMLSKVIQRLIDRVEVGENSVKIHYRLNHNLST